jgi:hypothetical protein
MTEAEWLTCSYPSAMLEYLRGKVSNRKLRLFAVACCRRVWKVLWTNEQEAVEVAERFVDGLATEAELDNHSRLIPWNYGATAAIAVCTPDAYRGTRACAEDASKVAAEEAAKNLSQRGRPKFGRKALQAAARSAEEIEWVAQAVLLREIIGNPFRTGTIDPSWLSWNDGTVPKMAQVIYEERRFEDLPVLADALEDAGCTDTAILNHCRAQGEHVRGCWVIDLLLGKS